MRLRAKSPRPKVARSVAILPAPSEHEECKWLMQWATTQRYRGVPLHKLLIHVPNGAYHGRDRQAGAVVAMKLRAQGLQAGVFDYILAVPFLPHVPGLWLEMKRTRGGTVSDDQQTFMALMTSMGYRCEVARGWVEGSEIILKYLKKGDGFYGR